ncbi:NAD(P)/FAD-dependent oxidoreductase [Schlesneria paludicola]|uniref:NAD(P)/FAD-dependent oxidoreductase n=1 Tax=Schlesneria paludicola TaxID=360056 RepID=UPI00138AEAE7|nr:FAD-dependent oxidoreductase [Schlesneria paludicola]
MMTDSEQSNHIRGEIAKRVAVVGAGISGLSCARILHEHGFNVTIFEKSRGSGGRTATRRADPDLEFDHGAQYFTVTDPLFEPLVQSWIERGIAAEWHGRIVEIDGSIVKVKPPLPKRYVGVPGMTAMARQLAHDVPIQLQSRIVQVIRDDRIWRIIDEGGRAYGPFDDLVVSLPSTQAADLLGEHPLAMEIRAIPMNPCWAVMVAFERPVNVNWDGAFVHQSPLAWVARNSSKPGRKPSPETWVLHANPEWSVTHLKSHQEDAARLLLDEFVSLTMTASTPIHLEAHRWMFSSTPLSLDRLVLFDENIGLVACGDWLAGGRVEGAFRSGNAAAARLLQHTATCH